MDEENLRKVVNASGFLFQFKIEDVIRTQSTHWKLISSEHQWHDPETNKIGFIDLVVGSSRLRGLIECKRTIEGHWIFPLVSTSLERKRRFRCLWAYQNTLGLDDFYASPDSKEAKFCVVRGSGEQDRPLLERLGSELIAATYSLAQEERRTNMRLGVVLYLPMIVTTSKLHVCELDTNDITLNSGKLPDSCGTFKEVQYVRFRKSLGTKLIPSHQLADLKESHLLREQTIFVINADALVDFLDSFEEDGKDLQSLSTKLTDRR